MNRVLRGAALAASLALAGPAIAHKPSDAYLTLSVNGTTIDQRLDIALRDLDRDLALDANDDGQLTWGEVRSRWPDIERVANDAVVVQADGQACQAAAPGIAQLDEHSDGHYAVLTRRWQCAGEVQSLSIGYGLFSTSDPTHRGVTQVRWDGVVMPAVLAAGDTPRVFKRGGPGIGVQAADGGTSTAHSSWLATATGFVIEGVHHILIGTDHILFLLALLLPVVLVVPTGGTMRAGARLPGGLRRSGPPMQAADDLRSVVINVLKVVTAFTVAHSITLALATLDVVNPPSRWIESVIAASVVFAALNNVFPVIGEGRWKITFLFGLVHGFGFASVLKDLGLDASAITAPLVGFNVGVEIGQLLVVGLFLPVAWVLRGTSFYRRWVFIGGSVLIALMALIWFVERAFSVRVLGIG